MMIIRRPHHTGMLPVLERLHKAKDLHSRIPRSKQSHAVPDFLCEGCTAFIARVEYAIFHFQEVSPTQRESVDVHYSSEEDLTRGVARGCHLCSKFMGVLYSLDYKYMLPNKIEEDYGDAIHSKLEERYVISQPVIGSSRVDRRKVDPDHVYSVTIGKIGKTTQRLDVFTHSLTIDYSDNLWKPATEAQTSSFTGSKACFQTVREWHQSCTSQHVLCKPEASLSRPTRLLDLDVDDTSDVRLVQGNLNDDPYATLSYSWGTIEQTMLLPSLYQQFQSRIGFKSLSNVIQDCITVCRGLSIRYLWVDALCIIQGAKGDFAQEAVRMNDIYGGSTITISAAATENTTQHFLVYRDALQIMDCALKADVNGRVGRIRNERLCTGARESNTRPGDYHIDSRAWTMQERFLSPRSIYFGPTGMHWECRKGIACEFHVDVDDQKLHKRPDWFESAKIGLKLEHISVSSLSGQQQTADRVIAMRHVWNRLLRCYSEMQLTNNTDKLVAISGVASLLERNTGFRASFGLWKEFFMHDLLWTTDMNTAYGATVLNQAPSWSWANLGGCLIHPSHAMLLNERRGVAFCVQTSTATLLSPPQDFGFQRLPSHNFCDGWLRIRGKLVPCGLQIDDRGNLHYYSLNPRMEATPSLIDAFATPTEELSQAELDAKGVFPKFCETWPNGNNFDPDTLLSVQQPDLFCMLIVSELEHRTEKSISNQYSFKNYGLVLTRVDGGRNHYRRLGVFVERYDNVAVEEVEEDNSRFRIPAEATYLWKNAGADQDVIIV